MTTGTMTWEQAVLFVLQDAGEPLHYTAVGTRIARQNLTRSVGANPAAGAMSTLRNLLKDNRVSNVVGQRGFYALPDIARDVAAVVEAQEVEETTPGRLVVNAYGLYWSRSLVNWEAAPTSSSARILGTAGSDPVNFADQDGIYLLHNGNEIAYVGQSYTPSSDRAGLYSRLRAHHNDSRKSDRWDSFSWFGFRPVDDNGNLSQVPESANIKDVIDLIEGILIEGIMPRLNMRRGEGVKAWETNLYNQVEDPQLIANRLSALTTIGVALR